MIISNFLLISGILISIIPFIIGWSYYYKTFPYWERKDFWEKYTWIGFITMYRKMKNFSEPGRTYARQATFFLNLGPVVVILMIILLNLVRFL